MEPTANSDHTVPNIEGTARNTLLAEDLKAYVANNQDAHDTCGARDTVLCDNTESGNSAQNVMSGRYEKFSA